MSTHLTLFPSEPGLTPAFVPPPPLPRGALTVADELWLGNQSEEVQAMFARLLPDTHEIARGEEIAYERGYAAGERDARKDGYVEALDEAITAINAVRSQFEDTTGDEVPVSDIECALERAAQTLRTKRAA